MNKEHKRNGCASLITFASSFSIFSLSLSLAPAKSSRKITMNFSLIISSSSSSFHISSLQSCWQFIFCCSASP